MNQKGCQKLAAFVLRCWNQADAYQHSWTPAVLSFSASIFIYE
jgi:hypothetical protein